MDTHFVLVLIVIIMSVAMVVLLTMVQNYQHEIAFLKDSIRIYQREKSRQRLAENLTTVSESTKELEHILQISSKRDKLLDKNSDLGPRTSAL